MKVVLRCMRRSIPGSPWHALLLPETGEEGEKGKNQGKIAPEKVVLVQTLNKDPVPQFLHLH